MSRKLRLVSQPKTQRTLKVCFCANDVQVKEMLPHLSSVLKLHIGAHAITEEAEEPK